MPSLMVDCKSCGLRYASGIAIQPEALGKVAMFNLSHRCPNCGAVGRFNTHEYILAETEAEPLAPAPPLRVRRSAHAPSAHEHDRGEEEPVAVSEGLGRPSS